MRRGVAFSTWATMDVLPPAKSKGPPRSETHAKQGKPVALPGTAGEPQGTLLALRVKDGGKSECPSVMGGIRAGISPDTKVGRLPPGHSWRESFD